MSAPDHRSLVSDAEVEAACQAAHDVLMSRRPTRLREPWESVPASERVEWREEQRAALEAAETVRGHVLPPAAVEEVRADEVRQGDAIYVGWLSGWQVVGDVRVEDGLVTVLDRYCDEPLFEDDPHADSLVVVRRAAAFPQLKEQSDGH